MDKLKLGIVGHGFVGKAVEFGFDTPNVDIDIADPRLGTSIDDLSDDVEVVFVAVPTPMGDDGKIDARIVISVVGQLVESTQAIIILKSTVTPDIVEAIAKMAPDRFVYNPEFLTEANAEEDFVNSTFNVIGGDMASALTVASIYENYSKCINAQPVFTTAVEASFVKYTINTFLSTKVTFFNQLKDQVDRFDNANFNNISSVVKLDPRIGGSHMQVPGPDGRRGFGGACFPKDTTAFHHFSGEEFDLLKKVLDVNSGYRLQYELDAREKEQNVKFGD